jgi:hypothetical protein
MNAEYPKNHNQNANRNFTYTETEGAEMTIPEWGNFQYAIDREMNHKLASGETDKWYSANVADLSSTQIDGAVEIAQQTQIYNKNICNIVGYIVLILILLFLFIIFKY